MKEREKRRHRQVVWGDVFPKSRLLLADNGESKRMRVEGAKKLLLCLEKEIKILLNAEVLHITGVGLSCTAYASGALEVAGEIREIHFERKNKQEGGARP